MSAAAKGLGGVGKTLLYWAPVWVPLILLWQVSTRGLKPALAEEARLDQEAELVQERHEQAQEEFEDLEREAAAWKDPVYRERVRRQLREGGQSSR